SSPIMADLDGNGDLEIAVGSEDGKFYVWHHDGTNYLGFPVTTTASISFSPAIGDLDNDGDNDLVVNNVNMPLFVYQNNSNHINTNHYLGIKFKGDSLNTFGVGSTIKIFHQDSSEIYYHQPVHGFQSSTAPNVLTMGVGQHQKIDSLEVIWPKGNYQTIKNLKTDSTYTIDIRNATKRYNYEQVPAKKMFSEVTKSLFPSIPKHEEDDFVDFDQERMMLQMLSHQNPYLVKGDINNDGLDDFYMSSSKGFNAAIYIQQKNGHFLKYIPDDFKHQNYLECAGAVFGDFDGDGDQDLIVSYGGNQETIGTKVLYPKFYENNGQGKFTWRKDKNIKVEINASTIVSSDFDHDGDLDLFIGSRNVVGSYGSAPNSYVFENDGKGNFKDISAKVLGKHAQMGMVTDAKWADLDGNGYEDLIVVGNWMGIYIFNNDHGKFTLNNTLENYKGWWSSVAVNDINGDGKLDIIAGNLGLNSKFKASEKEPMKIYIKDFDDNGTKECITTLYKSDHKAYVFHLKQDMVMQMPILKKRFLRYEDYAGKSADVVLTPEMTKDAEVHEINTLSSGVFFNKGANQFGWKVFPYQAQLSSVNSILIDDVNGSKQLILTGNSWDFKPEVGRLDANYGVMYQYQKNGFHFIPNQISGIKISGQVRSAISVQGSNHQKTYLFGRNNDTTLAFKFNK
ncbi:MAG: VCBS repeat-containing protein, partial [Bacteroidetes bacterium]|nr:VCBS repeat-containing protein [Bacteroidota bacterium]